MTSTQKIWELKQELDLIIEEQRILADDIHNAIIPENLWYLRVIYDRKKEEENALRERLLQIR